MVGPVVQGDVSFCLDRLEEDNGVVTQNFEDPDGGQADGAPPMTRAEPISGTVQLTACRAEATVSASAALRESTPSGMGINI